MTTPSFMSVAGLDLFRALVVGGPLTTRELAERTGFEERCVREWLGGQADRGYVTYDSKAKIFLLTPEQAARLDGGPALHAGQGLRQRTTSDQEVNPMFGMQVKSFESPDEVRPFEGNGKADVLERHPRTGHQGRELLTSCGHCEHVLARALDSHGRIVPVAGDPHTIL